MNNESYSWIIEAIEKWKFALFAFKSLLTFNSFVVSFYVDFFWMVNIACYLRDDKRRKRRRIEIVFCVRKS